MGINRFSIYSTFKSKQQLFLAALDRYEEHIGAKMREQLTAGEAGLSAIKRLFKGLTAAAEQGNRLGCFMCNCVIERSLVDPDTAGRVTDHFARLEEALHAVLQTARKKGEIKGKRNLRDCAAIWSSPARPAGKSAHGPRPGHGKERRPAHLA